MDDLDNMLERGYKLVSQLTRYIDYTSLMHPSSWPDKDEMKTLIDNSLRFAKDTPKIESVNSKKELYLLQMQRVLLSRVGRLAPILYNGRYELSDYLNVLDIKENDLLILKKYLEERQEEFNNIVNDRYQNYTLPEKYNIPFNRTFYENLEQEFYATIAKLFEVAKTYYGDNKFLIEELQREFNIHLVFSEEATVRLKSQFGQKLLYST